MEKKTKRQTLGSRETPGTAAPGKGWVQTGAVGATANGSREQSPWILPQPQWCQMDKIR